MAKLLTHHDKGHAHAILGFSSLLQFFLRLVLLPLLGLRNDRFHFLVLIHLVLALSSFIFPIPLNRGNLYTIYREMQLHTIVFSIRSLLVYAWGVSGGVGGSALRLAAVLAIHYAADVITAVWGTPTGGSTIRRFDGEKSLYEGRPLLDRIGVFLMSFAQLVGTWFLLASNVESAAIAAYALMLPVQGSAFLATLVRKGKVGSYAASLWYIGLIGLGFCWFPWTWAHFGYILFATFLRFYMRMNKFAMWTLLVVLASTSGAAPALFNGDVDFATVVPAVVAQTYTQVAGIVMPFLAGLSAYSPASESYPSFGFPASIRSFVS